MIVRNDCCKQAQDNCTLFTSEANCDLKDRLGSIYAVRVAFSRFLA